MATILVGSLCLGMLSIFNTWLMTLGEGLRPRRTLRTLGPLLLTLAMIPQNRPFPWEISALLMEVKAIATDFLTAIGNHFILALGILVAHDRLLIIRYHTLKLEGSTAFSILN